MNRGGYHTGHAVDISEDVHPNYVQMGSRVKIRSGTILFGSEQHPLKMGSDIYINAKCVLHGGAEQLTIGDRVTMAIGVLIHTDSGPNTSLLLQEKYPISAAPVTIEDDVWIGDYVIILPGVRVGHGSIIAAGAMIRHDVPPHTIVGGVPAKALKTLEEHKQHCHVCSVR